MAWSWTRGIAPQLNSNAGPVESEHDWSAVDAAEDVKLVVMQVDRDGIVGLVGRALRAKPWGHAKQDCERGKAEKLAV